MSIRASIASLLLITVPFVAMASAPETAPTAPSTLSLTPDTLRSQLFEGNIKITDALLSVHDAKDQINVARGNLLPSISLGGLLNSSGSPTFLLSSIKFLVPFLIPSNWFNYQSTKDQFGAELLSYRILQLNTYSSALSVYYTVLADQQYRDIYLEEAGDYGKIYEIKKRQYQSGAIPIEELLQTQAQAQLAQIRASQMTTLINHEIASLRSALGLPLETKIETQFIDIPAIDNEDSLGIAQAEQIAFQMAPEREQIEAIERSAVSQKWNTIFGFIDSASVSTASTGTKNASFGDLKNVSGSVSIGFGYYPGIKISARVIEHVRLRYTQLHQELTQVLEGELKSLNEYKEQHRLASSAEASMRDTYQILLRKYQLGSAALVEVLTARSQMLDASVQRIKAEHDLNLARATLHRTLLSGQFSDITGCRLAPAPDDKSSGWERFWRKVFGKTPSHKSLDELCRPSAALAG